MGKKVHLVAGARPNFMKIAPIYREMKRDGRLEPAWVFSGQHFDPEMTKNLWDDLELTAPDIDLSEDYTAKDTDRFVTFLRFQKRYYDELRRKKPKMVVVVGDTSTTLGGAYTARANHIPVAHVEAGLRSNYLDMPEELNRRIVDHISDLLLAPTDDAAHNLTTEDVPGEIRIVGNVMIDSLCSVLESDAYKETKAANATILVTLHRPENVDNFKRLKEIVDVLDKLQHRIGKVYFPCHPRTMDRLKSRGLMIRTFPWIRDPLPYVKFIKAMAQSTMVITDSGGVQEESTFLGKPCITLRVSGTERPETIHEGTNSLIRDPSRLYEQCVETLTKITNGRWKDYECSIPLWDGKSAKRIVDVLAGFLCN